MAKATNNALYAILGLLVYGTGFYWSIVEFYRPLGLLVTIVGCVLCSKAVVGYITQRVPEEEIPPNHMRIVLMGGGLVIGMLFFSFALMGFYIGIPYYTSTILVILGYVCVSSAIKGLLEVLKNDEPSDQ